MNAALEDTLKGKIVVDGCGEYVAKQEFEDDPEVLAALSDIRTARESARDTYYSDNVTDDLKAKIYVSSDVIFTSSAATQQNDTMIVKNREGQPLPDTGSAGTVIITILGIEVIVFAIIALSRRKAGSGLRK